jgi:hypothetical protein
MDATELMAFLELPDNADRQVRLVSPEPRVTRVIVVNLPLGDQAKKAKRDSPVSLAIPAFLVSLEIWADLEVKVIEVTQVLLVLEVHRVTRANQALRASGTQDLKAIPATKVHKVHPVSPGHPSRPAPRARSLAPVASPAVKERRANLDKPAHAVFLDKMVNLVVRAQLGQKEKKVYLDLQDQEAKKVCKACLVLSA